MTPDQEALQITSAWGCGGDSGATAMVRAVIIAERERCARALETHMPDDRCAVMLRNAAAIVRAEPLANPSQGNEQ